MISVACDGAARHVVYVATNTVIYCFACQAATGSARAKQCMAGGVYAGSAPCCVSFFTGRPCMLDVQNARRFLHRNEQYGLLSASISAAFGRVESGERADPTTARDAKVAQFRRCVCRDRAQFCCCLTET